MDRSNVGVLSEPKFRAEFHFWEEHSMDQHRCRPELSEKLGCEFQGKLKFVWTNGRICPVFSKLNYSCGPMALKGFAKPMFRNPVVFTKQRESRKRRRQRRLPQTRGLIARVAKITENTEMTKTTGIWGTKPRFPKTQV